MSEQTFSELESLRKAQGPAAVIDRLIAISQSEKNFHQLFDARLMQKKLAMGLPVVRPTSFDDVPAEKRDEFEKTYVAAAREVGELLLSEKNIPQAWMYLRTIREPQKVADAIAAIPSGKPPEEELIDIAFFQGVHPVKGIEMLLASHGTCSTITSFDQNMGNMTPEARKNCAAVLVRELYDDLRSTLEQEVQRRYPMNPPGQSIRELIAGRDFLFADDSYHIDVSHLNSVVRFARTLEANQPELKLAIELAQYGSRLSPQYQYAGNAPFEEFYPSHIHYFKAIQGDGRDEALAYFRDKLGNDAGDPNNQLAAFAYLDLLQRLGHHEEALDIACKYLTAAAGDFGLSIPELCAKAGRYDTLRQWSRDQNDLLGYTAALVQG